MTPVRNCAQAWWTTSRPEAAISLAGSLLGLCNTTIKVAASLFCLLPGTAKTPFNEWANRGIDAYSKETIELPDEKMVLPLILRSVVYLINPFVSHFDPDPENLSAGYLSKRAAPLFRQAQAWAKDYNSFYNRHVASRGAYLAAAVAMTIAKTIEVAAGILLAAAVVITAGRDFHLNCLAVNYLAAFDGVSLLCKAVRGAVNPHQNLAL